MNYVSRADVESLFGPPPDVDPAALASALQADLEASRARLFELPIPAPFADEMRRRAATEALARVWSRLR